MKTNEKVIIALLAGTIGGALIGVLFAPRKGKETRNKIREERRKAEDFIREMVNAGKENLEQLSEPCLRDKKAEHHESESAAKN